MARKTKDPVMSPPERAMLDWKPSQIKAAEIQADAGNLQMAADLCETLLADDRIQGVLTARTRGLIGLPLTFERSGDKRRSNRAIRALEAEEDWWAAYHEEELGALMDWSILLGVGLGQHAWTEVDSGRVVPALKKYHPRWLRYDWQTHAWFARTESFQEVQVVPGDSRWVLHTPSGGYRPWVDGAWRSLSRWWLLKHYARQDFALHSEVHGQPLRVGVAPEGSLREHREELASDLASLGRDTAMALPPGYDLKLVEATAKTWEMFRAQVEMADLAMTIRLAGTNLTAEVTSGSLAAATVHRSIRQDIIRGDGQTLATTLHDQSLAWWAEYNFGNRSLAPWPVWQTDLPEDASTKADTLLKQAQAIAALRAVGVDVEPILEDMGLKASPVQPDQQQQPVQDGQPST